MNLLKKIIVPVLLVGLMAACSDDVKPQTDTGQVTITPDKATVKAGEQATFTATVEGKSDGQVRWSLPQGTQAGTVTSDGVYTASETPGTYSLLATNVADTSKTSRATITVVPSISVSVKSDTAVIYTGSTTLFTATVQAKGTTNLGVTWSVLEGDAGGTFTSAGRYKAPTTPGTYHVVATSMVDASVKAVVAVEVVAVKVTVTPDGVTLDQGAATILSATLLGPAGTSVTWSVQEGAAGGTVTPSGVYSAPNKAGTYHVIATSTADTTKAGSATITVRPITLALDKTEATVSTAASTPFRAIFTGTVNTGVTWSIQEGAAGGTISSAGVYTAPTSGGTFHVVATSKADSTVTATATVTVTPVAVTVTPDTATLDQGASTPLQAQVTGTANTSVIWSIQEGAAGGAVTADGVYTAPKKAGTYHVVATSAADHSKAGSATLTVRPVTVTLSDAAPTLSTASTFQFIATVAGTVTPGVTWKVQEGAAGGAISSAGVYKAPTAAGTYHVVATSVADTTVSATATVTVIAVSVAVAPNTTTLDQGAHATFQAHVTGTSDTSVTWSIEEGASGGTLSAAGEYVAPNKAGTFHIVATSTVDDSKSGTATITVRPVTVTLSDTTATVSTAGTFHFSATVAGSVNHGVTWTVQEGASGGTITTDGDYTAPLTGGTYHVIATSVADATVSDTATITVKQVAVSVAPTSATVDQGEVKTFTADVTGSSNLAVNWTVQEGAAGGSITSTGAYTAPNTAGTYHVVATSQADGSKSDTATVTVRAVALALDRTEVNVITSGTYHFNATVTGTVNTGVTWTVQEGASGGSITTAGVYSAPATNGTYHVIATSVADVAIKAVATVTVSTVAVMVNPAAITLNQGDATTFTADVTGTSNTGVTWTVQEGASGGSITSAGAYTAPTHAGTYHVIATSVADPTHSGSATVVVRPIVVTLSDAAPTVAAAGTFHFGATVTGTDNTGVTWSVQEGAAGGSITASGDYTAPNKGGTYHVIATSQANTSSTAVATVTVTSVEVAVSPATTTLDQGATVPFQANVTGAAVNTVTWTILEGASGGTITAAGAYTAPAKAGTYHVVATSTVDTSVSSSATVTVHAVTVTLADTTVALSSGGAFHFSASVTGTVTPGVTWSVQEGTSGGTITASGDYTAPPTGGTYHVTATSVGDATVSATATVTVTQVAVSVAPNTATLEQAEAKTFTATVTGTSNSAVTWTIQEGASGGTITADGIYTAPNKAGTYHVVATSNADVSKSDTATVTVGSVTVTLADTTAALSTAGTFHFAATVTGTKTPGVNWSVQEGAAGGTITANGDYTAPAAGGTFHVIATSKGDATAKATATVTVTLVVVAVTPTEVTLDQGDTKAFQASVTGTSNIGVTWSIKENTGPVGSVTSDGVYTAPFKSGTFHVVAKSNADGSKTGVVTVTVRPVVVTLANNAPTVSTGGSFAFGATVTGTTASHDVTWSVQEGSRGGTITAAGVYSAPLSGGTFHVTATSVANTASKAYATVTVTPVAVTVSPATATLDQGASQRLTATVTGTTNENVTWSIQEGAAGGDLTSDGVYTAPAHAGTYHVVATSAADGSKKGTATLTVSPVTVALANPSTTVAAAGSFHFSATVAGTVTSGVTWSIEEGAAGGSITSDGDYTAPAVGGTYHVIATSVADATAKATATVTVTPVTVAVSPNSVAVNQGETKTFVAHVTGTSTTSVTWTVEEGAAGGAITSAGVYTAPNTAGTYHVVATSTVDASKSSSATITVRPVTVTLDPTNAALAFGGSQHFTATVTGTATTGVTWSIQEGAAGGSITASGDYSAPSTAGTYHVVATSVADASAKATATVSVSSVSLALSPTSVDVTPGGQFTFTAVVTGSANTAVTWSTSAGSITQAGVYTAPSEFGTATVTATSEADPSVKATAIVTIRAASGLVYTDPSGLGWKLVRNATESTPTHLVLDLVGPVGELGRGVALTLSAPPALTTWAHVATSDTEFVTNRAFALGGMPQLLKGTVAGNALRLGVFQKGTSAPAVVYADALVSVALELNTAQAIPAGTVITLAVDKAHALPGVDTLGPITVAVGELKAQ
ncbi:hypothetical protein JGU66_17075 [Myxococcaceae bacterium JPH2]|nr:hypothetical protein [Myxococcaceae bacterium JPH2]